VIDNCFPGLTSIATKALTDDYKCSLKVKLAILSLWTRVLKLYTPRLQQSLLDFSDRQRAFKAVTKAQNVKRLRLRVNQKEGLEDETSDALEGQAPEPDETLERLCQCFEYILSKLYKIMTHGSLLQEIGALTNELLASFQGSTYDPITFNLTILHAVCLL
jgi:hypothetical protein